MINFQLNTDSELIKKAFDSSLMFPANHSGVLQDVIVFDLRRKKTDIDILPEKIKKYLKYSNRIVKDNLYVTRYNEDALIISDLENRRTSGYFDMEILPEKSVSVQSLMFFIKDHMLRHLIFHDYMVLHAGAVCDKKGRMFIIAGKSGMGKSSFIMNAHHSEEYQIIADDKCVFSLLDKRIFKNLKNIRLLKNDFSSFQQHFIDEIQLEKLHNEKFSISLFDEKREENWVAYDKKSTFVIWLEGESENGTITELKDADAVLDEMFSTTQENLYLFHEKNIEKQAKAFLEKLPVLSIIRNSNEHVFNIFDNKIKKDELFV